MQRLGEEGPEPGSTEQAEQWRTEAGQGHKQGSGCTNSPWGPGVHRRLSHGCTRALVGRGGTAARPPRPRCRAGEPGTLWWVLCGPGCEQARRPEPVQRARPRGPGGWVHGRPRAGQRVETLRGKDPGARRPLPPRPAPRPPPAMQTWPEDRAGALGQGGRPALWRRAWCRQPSALPRTPGCGLIAALAVISEKAATFLR